MAKRIRSSGGQAGDTTVIIVGGGTVDYTADIGTETNDIDQVAIEFGPVDMGGDSQGVPSDELSVDVTTPIGTNTDDYEADSQFAGTQSAGTDSADDQDGFTLTFGVQPAGDEESSVLASSVTEVTDYADTATATGDWVDATDAEDQEDGSFASISQEAGLGVTNAAGVLTCSFDLPTVDLSELGTRGSVLLSVWHRLDTTLALTSNADAELWIQRSGGGGRTRLLRSTREATSPVGDVNVRNDTVIAEEVFDITTTVAGWTEAQLESAVLEFDLTCGIISLGGDCAWEVDAAAIRRTYTKTGIT